MDTIDTRAEKRKIAVNLLATIFEKDLECLGIIHTAEALEDWKLIAQALDDVSTFIDNLKTEIL
jgi:hypothetical protein